MKISLSRNYLILIGGGILLAIVAVVSFLYWQSLNTVVSVVSVSPEQGAEDVAVTSVVSVEFDGDYLMDSASLIVSPGEIKWVATPNPKQLQIVPDAALLPVTNYSLAFDYTNPHNRSKRSVSVSFTTRGRPSLVRTTPVKNARNVPLSEDIRLTFSEKISPGAVDIIITPDLLLNTSFQENSIVSAPNGGLFEPSTTYTISYTPSERASLVDQIDPYELVFTTTDQIEEIQERIEEQEKEAARIEAQSTAEEQAAGDLLFFQESKAAMVENPRLGLMNSLPYYDDQGFSVSYDLTSDSFTITYDSSNSSQKAAEGWLRDVSPYLPTAEEAFWFDTNLPPHAFGE